MKLQLENDTINPSTAWRNINKKTLWHCYSYYINNENPGENVIATNADIDAAVQAITASIHDAVEKSTITLTNKPCNRLNLPNWIWNKLKTIYDAKKKWSKYHRPEDKRLYKKLATELKNHIANFKEKSWNEFITNIEQRWIFDEMEQAEYAADFFAQQFTNTRETDPDTYTLVRDAIRRLNNEHEDESIVLTAAMVASHIKAVKTRKAAGPDGLSNKALKLLPIKQINYITSIFNACLKNHYFPVAWKKANIITIAK